MKTFSSWLALIAIVTVPYYKGLASDDFGSVIFTDPMLQKHLNEELGPHVVASSAIAFLDEFIEDEHSLALVIWMDVSELERENIPIQVIGIAAAKFTNEQSSDRQVASGVWLRNISSGEEHQLASCEALIPVPNDLDVFKEESAPYQKLLSPNQIAMTCFIIKMDAQEQMICTNGFIEDYGENAPTVRSKTFAKLYELINKVWTGDRDDFARIISESE